MSVKSDNNRALNDNDANFDSTRYIRNYLVPANLNYAWTLGFVAIVSFVIQLVTGLLLSFNYIAHLNYAFSSVMNIQNNIDFGWFIRAMHQAGSYLLFFVLYLHILKALYYGSFKSPRRFVWIIGVILFFIMLTIAFTGYILPLGNMSFWSAKVISNVISYVPLIGNKINLIIFGEIDFTGKNLNRIFTWHYLLSFILVILIGMHILMIHRRKINNPSGIDLNKSEYVNFYPYIFIKDLLAVGIYFVAFFYVICFLPHIINQPSNLIPADIMSTPSNIIPEWYFLPFYTILKSIPDKTLGAVLFFCSFIVLFLIPLLDRSKIRAATTRPIYFIFLLLFVLNFILLTYLGGVNLNQLGYMIARISITYYFAYFLIILPIISLYENKFSNYSIIDKLDQNSVSYFYNVAFAFVVILFGIILKKIDQLNLMTDITLSKDAVSSFSNASDQGKRLGYIILSYLSISIIIIYITKIILWKDTNKRENI